MTIPTFPEFKPLELEDQQEINFCLTRCPPETSDYTFANLYLWRQYDKPKLTRINGNLVILLSPVGENPYFLFPVGENQVEVTFDTCFHHLKNGPQIKRVPEKIVKKYFEKKLEYSFELDHNNSDYVYRVTDLVNLRGRKYDGKRNWIKKFMAKYPAEYLPLDKKQVSGCLGLLERWGKSRQGPILKYELLAITEALNNYDKLGLTGRVILCAGQVEAFLIGGELNRLTAMVYIQVANREKAGLPQYFHQKYAATELAGYKFANWEQDLGIPGLRKAKQSYHPYKMQYKYDVTRLK